MWVPTFLLSSDLIFYPWGQLSRYDTTLKTTKAILKKIIRLTIETGTLTGTYILFQSSIYVTDNEDGSSQPSLVSCAFH